MSNETPRERIDWSLKFGVMGTLPAAHQHDIRAVLSANAGYEQIMRMASSRAVREYKTNLAAELRERASKVPADEVYITNLAADALESVADDLEDGSL